MNLPIPNPAQIAELKQIYLEEFGKELTPDEAWDAATTMLQLFYAGTYGHRAHRKPETVEASDFVPATPRAKRRKKRVNGHATP